MKRLLSIFKRRAATGDDAMAVFKKKYAAFKALLESNSELLKLISDMEEKLRGRDTFGDAYLRRLSIRLMFHARRMVQSLEMLSGQAYDPLETRLGEIREFIHREIDREPAINVTEYVIDHDRITRDMVDFVGGKNANLGEVANRAGLRVPRGFAITTAAFDRFIHSGDLLAELRRLKMEIDPEDPSKTLRISEDIERLFREAPMPGDIKTAIVSACRSLDPGKETSPPLRLALRSSAVGEDSQRSFAGQHLSLLNLAPREILSAYRRIVASLFSPQAIAYRARLGIPVGEAAMGVVCQRMIPAVAGGVMYTRHPFHRREDHIIINAVWGLGPYAVDGVISPDRYELSKNDPPDLLSRRISDKPVRLRMDPRSGVKEESVAPDLRRQACLTTEQAAALARMGCRLEAHFQSPQDVEWALDTDGGLWVLQSRPLKFDSIGEIGALPDERFAELPLLLEGGDIASPGVAAGPAFPVRSEADLAAFPDGAVLVAAQSSSRYAVIMNKARAILADAGSVTGHMATVAREFGIPAIFNLGRAMKTISPGVMITVDACSGKVYEGGAPEPVSPEPKAAAFMQGEPVYERLRKLADQVVPLHLLDPKSPDFSARNCRTVHDIMRFCHEMSYGELFQISRHISERSRISVRLKAPLPIDLHVIDLGGGIRRKSEKKAFVTPEMVASVPFKALLDGMLREDLRAIEPRPLNMGGFLSVMSRQILSPPDADLDRFGERSFAIVSDKYLNFSSRIGYHYSVLDAYCGDTSTNNYIHFEFKGGAADDVRRHRRACMIREVLRSLGFMSEALGDRVTARFGKQPRPVIMEKLDMLGRLIVFTRQMDMLMNDEESVNAATACFLNGDYRLTCLD